MLDRALPAINRWPQRRDLARSMRYFLRFAEVRRCNVAAALRVCRLSRPAPPAWAAPPTIACDPVPRQPARAAGLGRCWQRAHTLGSVPPPDRLQSYRSGVVAAWRANRGWRAWSAGHRWLCRMRSDAPAPVVATAAALVRGSSAAA